MPVRRWSDGAAEVAIGLRDGKSRLRHLYQSDPCRVLFPRVPAGAPMEVVVVTTSGGIVGGDRLRFRFEAHEGSTAAFTAQAAEKVYRSAGAVSELSVSATVHDGAFLEWMPQETILFDGARMRRRNRAELTGTGRILTGEIVVFGRRARGEVFSSGYLHDEWRVYRDGRLTWADALHLEGDTGARIDNRFAFGGAASVGTLIYAGGDAEAQLAAVRSNLGAGAGGVRCAATRIGEVLIVRFLGADAAALRMRFADLWKTMRHAVAGYPARLPRVWEV
ncbi:MAG: urease accessory protein UreD [Rhodospirillaceae bacterium]